MLVIVAGVGGGEDSVAVADGEAQVLVGLAYKILKVGSTPPPPPPAVVGWKTFEKPNILFGVVLGRNLPFFFCPHRRLLTYFENGSNSIL